MNFSLERDIMVRDQLQARGIRDPRVLAAMRSIPREQFVHQRFAHLAYTDHPVDIGHGQTISQPYMTALMCQELSLRGSETVLEIGTGCGYHAAVLAWLAARVYTLEVIPGLAALALHNLGAAGFADRVQVVSADGSRGYPERMPYDAISVAAAAPEIPPALLEQLADPGRLVIPVGTREDQDLRVVIHSGGSFHFRTATLCRFVPLTGEFGWHD